MKFIKNNFVYVLWFALYFFLAWGILGGTKDSFIFVSVFYVCSITFALSPAGEWLLRQIEDVRPLRTREEKEYLQPIFNEVYEAAQKENPKLNKKIRLYISSSMCINAFAIGRKTIAVTTGAIQTLSEEELKGVIAHEFGHITHGHTKALLLSVIGNSLFSIFVVIARIFMFVGEIFSMASCDNAAGAFCVRLVAIVLHFSFDITLLFFSYLGNIILSLNSRSNEYQADQFASNIGYSEELTNALYLLQKLDMGQKMSLREKMTASHPHITKRIERLESMNEMEYQKA